MKTSVLIFCLIGLTGCASVLRIPASTMSNIGTSLQRVASADPTTEGNTLKAALQRDFIPQIRRKANRSRRSLSRGGGITTAIGTISTGVTGLIDDGDDLSRKRWAFGFSLATTTVGLVQVFQGANDEYKTFLAELETAIAQWDISPQKQTDFNMFRTEVNRILARYGDLYEEDKPAGKG